VCALGSLPTKADGPGFAGRAEDRIDEVVMETAQRWGIETAARYNRLVFAALEAIGISPALPGSRPVSSLPDVLSFHLRSGRRLVAQEHRVRDPRHLLLADGVRRGVGAGSHGGLGRNGMWRVGVWGRRALWAGRASGSRWGVQTKVSPAIHAFASKFPRSSPPCQSAHRQRAKGPQPRFRKTPQSHLC
jgi:hypothetical protein